MSEDDDGYLHVYWRGLTDTQNETEVQHKWSTNGGTSWQHETITDTTVDHKFTIQRWSQYHRNGGTINLSFTIGDSANAGGHNKKTLD